MGLERVSRAGVSYGAPPDFYAGYGCVIATGAAALQAAASGVPVIVADERGSAGLVTRPKLQQILEAGAEPACFDSATNTATLLAARSESQKMDAAALTREMLKRHSEPVRARQWADWLIAFGEVACRPIRIGTIRQSRRSC